MRSLLKKFIVVILTFESRLIIRRHRPSIIAVTGSVGKTSTKDAIYAVLCEVARARKSEKSFNSEIGVPLTILGRPNAWSNPFKWLQILLDGLLVAFLNGAYPDWLVLEIGADHPGDIRGIVRWLPVDIAVITRLPEVPVHVEFFDSPEEVVEEKASLITGLKPSGALVLSADDPRVLALQERAGGKRILTFGFSPQADVAANSPSALVDGLGRIIGMRARVLSGDAIAELEITGSVGAHVFAPALAAIAVGALQNMRLSDMAESLERNYAPPPGRMHIVPGMRDSLIIDDSYNSSPAAAKAALETLASLPTKGKKIAVLGDMMELGRFSVEEHRKAGALAAKSCDLLMTVGIRARDIAGAALDLGMPEVNILQFENADQAGEELARRLAAGDIALIKGSQAVRLEKAVKLAMAHPEQAPELLVRQEEAWSMR